jgi:hypothetical protein
VKEQAGNANTDRLEELKENYEGNTYQIGGEDSPEKTYTVTEIGISEYGHLADKGEIYSTIEYDDGYVCHPSAEVLENQVENSEKVVE